MLFWKKGEKEKLIKAIQSSGKVMIDKSTKDRIKKRYFLECKKVTVLYNKRYKYQEDLVREPISFTQVGELMTTGVSIIGSYSLNCSFIDRWIFSADSTNNSSFAETTREPRRILSLIF